MAQLIKRRPKAARGGPGSRVLSTRVEPGIKAELQALADAQGISLSELFAKIAQRFAAGIKQAFADDPLLQARVIAVTADSEALYDPAVDRAVADEPGGVELLESIRADHEIARAKQARSKRGRRS